MNPTEVIGYACLICDTPFATKKAAMDCAQGHEPSIVYEYLCGECGCGYIAFSYADACCSPRTDK